MNNTPAQSPPSSSGFRNMGIAPNLLASLDRLSFVTPTPIQHQSIPTGIEGKDIIGIAQTGTGKTLAFGIPMIQRIGMYKGRGLIVLPTRELALQVEEMFQKVGRSIGLRTVVLIGGANMGRQMQQLKLRPHVIIATPGRLIDHMKQKTVSLTDIKILVLDEADRMFDMGFAPQLNQILAAVQKDRQTLLFSATMPPEIASIAARHMKMPVRIEVAPSGSTVQKVEQELFIISKDQKLQLLEKLLTDTHGSILVFSRTKHGAKRICRVIVAMGHTAAELHSNKSLAQRVRALEDFKTGRCRILVATDIAARGIDVSGIELVVNYDLPDNTEDYVHRIGRTGRAGNTGRAVSFAEPNQRGDIKSIERLIRKTLPILQLPPLPPQRAFPRAQIAHRASGGKRPWAPHRANSHGGGHRRFGHR